MTTNESFAKTAKVHAMARNIIADKIRQLGSAHSYTRANQMADAILAELAAHEPPLLICTPDEMKE